MLTTLFNLVFALFFILLGLMGLIIPWSSLVRTEVIDFLFSNTITLSLFGAGFLIIGLGVLFQILNSTKRKYTTLHHKEVTIDISEEVINDYLSSYFKELFPLNEVPFTFVLKKNRGKLVADLPNTPKEAQKELLKTIEDDLLEIFRDHIGYRHELSFAFSFDKSKNTL